MSWTELLSEYGLWSVLLGTFFEGEAVLLLAGGLSQQHYSRRMPFGSSAHLALFAGT